MSRVPVSRSSDKISDHDDVHVHDVHVHDVHDVHDDPDHDAFFLPDMGPSHGVPMHSVRDVAVHVRWLHGNRKPVPVRRSRVQGPAPDEEPLV